MVLQEGFNTPMGPRPGNFPNNSKANQNCFQSRSCLCTAWRLSALAPGLATRPARAPRGLRLGWLKPHGRGLAPGRWIGLVLGGGPGLAPAAWLGLGAPKFWLCFGLDLGGGIGLRATRPTAGVRRRPVSGGLRQKRTKSIFSLFPLK